MTPRRADGRRGRLLGGLLALGLTVGVLAVARPKAVWQLLAGTDLADLAAAAVAAALVLCVRGLRLAMLFPKGRLSALSATLVAAAAQAAAQFVPARAGELALPLLLGRRAAVSLSAGLGVLLATRALDLAALGAWAGLAVALMFGRTAPLALVGALALLLPALLLPLTLAAADFLALRLLAPSGRRGRRWTRRLRRVRAALDELKARPWRLSGAAVLSLAMWGGMWLVSWLLVRALGHEWSLAMVLKGAPLAALANLVPVNLVANLGTVEAGWTAAFHALGVALDEAAASGFAVHILGLMLAAAYGALGWVALAARRDPDPDPDPETMMNPEVGRQLTPPP